MSELIENRTISSELPKVSKCNEIESQLVTRDETATNQTFNSLGSVVMEENTCEFTRDSMFTRTRKNSQYVWGKYIASYYTAASATEEALAHESMRLVFYSFDGKCCHNADMLFDLERKLLV